MEYRHSSATPPLRVSFENWISIIMLVRPRNYSIVEDLAQAPSAMSSLDVLQTFSAQRKALLKAIGGIAQRIRI
jgi:hypothetical protein